MAPVVVLGALVLLALLLRGKDAAAAPVPLSYAKGLIVPPERERMRPPRPTKPSSGRPVPKPKPVPPRVAEAVRDMAANTATEAQLREASAEARASGFGETAAVMDQTAAAIAEIQAAKDVPPSVLTAIEAATSGTATAAGLRKGAADARKARLLVTAAMLEERAVFVETGRYPSGPGATEQAQIAAAVSDLRGGRASLAQLDAAADAATRQGMPETAAALRDATKRPTLRRGSKGPAVREAQDRLRALAHDPGVTDGDFGKRTETAVRAFQKSRALVADGIIGPRTWAALMASPAPAVAGDFAPSRPWPDVSAEAWARFVRAMAIGDVDTVTETGKLGLFLYDPRRLEDLGLMSSVRESGERKRWTFDDEARWLKPGTQVNAFARDMARMRDRVESEHAGELGKEHAGRAATLSGLLAVAHAGGLKGLASWLQNPDDVTRYPNTTKMFLRANGIF